VIFLSSSTFLLLDDICFVLALYCIYLDAYAQLQPGWVAIGSTGPSGMRSLLFFFLIHTTNVYFPQAHILPELSTNVIPNLNQFRGTASCTAWSASPVLWKLGTAERPSETLLFLVVRQSLRNIVLLLFSYVSNLVL
jgi:hypothetical protein